MMQLKNKLIIIISIALLCIVSVPSALAYFYTYAQTEGVVTVKLYDKSDIEESFKDRTKLITITADEDSDPVFVRVCYVIPSNVIVEVTVNEGWIEDGEYYYYTKPIDGKDASSVIANATDTTLDIKIPAEGNPEGEFNVIVLHEMTPALFSETEPSATYKFFDSEKNGWWYADWTTIVEPDTEVDG